MNSNTIPQIQDLKVAPYGAQVYTDFERGRQFVTLFYRHKLAGPRDRQLALLFAVIDDLTGAGLIVERDGVEVNFAPEIREMGTVQTPDTPYRIHLKVPVRPLAAEQAAAADFAAAIRAHFASKAVPGKKGKRQ